MSVVFSGEDRLVHWLQTRHYRLLLSGGPAILVGLLVLTAFFGQSQSLAVADRYLSDARQALGRNNLVAADLYARKVLQLDPTRSEASLVLAQIAQQKGDVKRAEQLLTVLAPDERRGYPAAHFLRGTRMLRNKRQWTKPELARLIHHLNVAASQNGLRADALQTLGYVYAAQRDWPQAINCFQAVANQRPELRLQIAQIHILQNDAIRAKSALDSAVDDFQQRVAAKPDDTQSRVCLAKALCLRGDWGGAEAVLRARLDSPDAPRCRTELAALYVAKSDQITMANSLANVDQRLNLLRIALEIVPADANALSRLAALAGFGGADVAPVREALRQALASGRGPAMVHLLLGIIAADSSESGTAMIHFQQSAQLDARIGEVLNNLALLLAQREPAASQRALKLLDVALKAWPENTDLRATRERLTSKPTNDPS